jgi:hypothetical protein
MSAMEKDKKQLFKIRYHHTERISFVMRLCLCLKRRVRRLRRWRKLAPLPTHYCVFHDDGVQFYCTPTMAQRITVMRAALRRGKKISADPLERYLESLMIRQRWAEMHRKKPSC